MKKYINGQYIDLTPAEITEMEAEQRKAAIAERRRPLTESEVTNMLIRSQINSMDVDDQTALRMLSYYPEWAVGVSYAVGYKLQYNGKLYKVITAHTSQADWTPDVAVTLFERIDETHDGSEYDPIPYEGNMALVSGLYYMQDYEIYRCIRDTVNPVYAPIADLVGIYVEKA